MGKLHEILAVEKNAETVASNGLRESQKSFGKAHLFSGETKSHKIHDDENQHLKQETTEVAVESTVRENLQYLFDETLTPYYDIVLQKDKANQLAMADVVIDGKTILKDVPGVTLLGLESKLNVLMDTLRTMPTLAPGVNWVADPTSRNGVYKSAQPDRRSQAISVPDFMVMYKATDKHPAQIKEFETRKEIGFFEVTSFSGMISSHEKAEYLKRVQALINAVKKARQRANCVEVPDAHIGQEIRDFILG